MLSSADLRSVLGALDHVPAAVAGLADRTGLAELRVLAALHVLRARGLAEQEHMAYALPTGLSSIGARVVFLLGERGRLAADDVAAHLGIDVLAVEAALRRLRAAGRVSLVGGAWSLSTADNWQQTARGIADALAMKTGAGVLVGRC